MVTGSAGFIGSHLVEFLAARGEHVVGVDRRLPAVRLPGDHILADLADPAAGDMLHDVCRSASVVFHLAASSGVRSRLSELERLRDNVVAGRRVLRAVHRQLQVVVTSSSSVYGGCLPARAGGFRPNREDDPLRPRGSYARSKVEVERACAERAAAGGSVAVARPFTVGGERQRPDMALSRWLQAARLGEPLRVFGSPDRVRDVTDVREVVRGLVAMAEREVQGVVNLGSGQGHRLSELTAAVAEVTGVPVRLLVEKGHPEEVPVTLADTGRCSRLLGFVPRTDLADLLRRQALSDPARLEEAG